MKLSGLPAALFLGCTAVMLLAACGTSAQHDPAPAATLSFRYEVEDKDSLHYRFHANECGETGVIRAYLSQGSRHLNVLPVVNRSEGYPIAFQAGPGECFRFGVTRLWSTDAIADDWSEWDILLASDGRLVDDLKRGGKGCKLIAVHRSLNPPNSLLIADEFSSVRTTRQGAMLAFELKWKQMNPQSVFSAGSGLVVGRIKAD